MSWEGSRQGAMQQAPPDHANMSHNTQLPMASYGNSNFRGNCGHAAPMVGQQEPHASSSSALLNALHCLTG